MSAIKGESEETTVAGCAVEDNRYCPDAGKTIYGTYFLLVAISVLSTTINEKQPMTSYSRSVANLALSRLVVEILTTCFSKDILATSGGSTATLSDGFDFHHGFFSILTIAPKCTVIS